MLLSQRSLRTGFDEFLQELLHDKCLHGTAGEGITKLVLASGIEKLKPAQLFVFEKYVIGQFTIDECPTCFTSLEWNEMLYVRNEGMCPACANRAAKGE